MNEVHAHHYKQTSAHVTASFDDSTLQKLTK